MIKCGIVIIFKKNHCTKFEQNCYSAAIKLVALSLVTKRINEPFFGRSAPLVHLTKVLQKNLREIVNYNYSDPRNKYPNEIEKKTYSAMKSVVVHVEKSAFGIHLRFIGVSIVIGKMETTNELSGKPDLSCANDFVNW